MCLGIASESLSGKTSKYMSGDTSEHVTWYTCENMFRENSEYISGIANGINLFPSDLI